MHYDNDVEIEKNNKKCLNCKRRKKFINEPTENPFYDFEIFFKIPKE